MPRKRKPVDPSKETYKTTISLPTKTFEKAEEKVQQMGEVGPKIDFSKYVAWLIEKDTTGQELPKAAEPPGDYRSKKA